MTLPNTAASSAVLSAAATQYPLPPTEQLLLQGGDARIALGTDGRSNRYGCTPRPDTDLLAFGSSTASSISETGFAAADLLRRNLVISAGTEAPQVSYQREINRLRNELGQLCSLQDTPGTDVIFAASGTDLHLIVTQLVAAAGAVPTLVIMVDPQETGRGVPLAVAGKHFNARSALGDAVEEGAPVIGAAAVRVATVPVRLADGTPRTVAEMDAEVESLAAKAIDAHHKVLLIVTDVTKTGMIAPSISCALGLRNRLPESLDVMVDACQFRIARATLHAYLQHDFLVALTGSKFLTGPTFAGAVLVPRDIGRRLRRQPLPPALSAYSSRADWPVEWAAPQSLDDTANFGLLLRWQAAMAELRAFQAVPEAEVARFIRQFSAVIQTRIDHDPALSALPTPVIDRRVLNGAVSWDQLPTIFPFLLHHAEKRGGKPAGKPLNSAETMEVYRLLQSDLSDRVDLQRAAGNPGIASRRCQLGQPVPCGSRDGIAVSALRLCLSARLIVEAANNEKQAAQVIERALAVLEKTAMLAAALA